MLEKIKQLYPELTDYDFTTSVIVQNDCNGRGPYLAAWNHPTLPKPTAEQLA